ncbi:MAG: vWA domain-containing protein, partial [Oceanococcus sp.]
MMSQTTYRSNLGYFFSAVLLASAAGWSGQTLADDTEVFFPPVDVVNDETVRPNIMFIMDTSGSMGTRDGGRGTPTRLEKVQDAMVELLGKMNQNVNVGLMRLSDDEGGPVLFPVSHIEAAAEDVLAQGACAVGDSGGGAALPIFGVSEEITDWAHEFLTSGDVSPGENFALAGRFKVGVGGGSGASTTLPTIDGNKKGDAEYRPGGGNEYNGNSDDDLDLAAGGDTDVNVRFEDIDVPVQVPPVTIIDARITFKQSGYS